VCSNVNEKLIKLDNYGGKVYEMNANTDTQEIKKPGASIFLYNIPNLPFNPYFKSIITQ